MVYFEKKDYLRAYYELNAASKLDSFNKALKQERASLLLFLYRESKSAE
jgi:hypothetical protein